MIRIQPLLLLTFASVATACGTGSSKTETAAPTTTGTPGTTESGTTIDTDNPDITDNDAQGVVVINELVPSNTNGLQDESGAYPDWIELYNTSDEAVDLSGWTITDDFAVPDRDAIPDGVTIEAHGYIVFFADDDEEEGPTHLNFNLDATGEQLGLYNADGVAQDELEFGAMSANVSVARVPDGASTWAILSTPTPGATNGG